ncbi:unnamed protein product [Calypogeia fissa]
MPSLWPESSSSLGINVPPSEVVVSLLQHGLYEMAFSLVFLCWKDSSQQRELETVFQVMARKCCLLQLGTGFSSPHKIPEDLQSLILVPDSPSTDLEPYGVLSTEKESDDVRVIGEAADFNGPWKGFS